jgi:dienelactone hydrolase
LAEIIPWPVLTEFQDNLRRGGVNWEVDTYGGAKHSFIRPDAATRSSPQRSRYDPQADRRSWRAMLDFLGEVFGEFSQPR